MNNYRPHACQLLGNVRHSEVWGVRKCPHSTYAHVRVAGREYSQEFKAENYSVWHYVSIVNLSFISELILSQETDQNCGIDVKISLRVMLLQWGSEMAQIQ